MSYLLLTGCMQQQLSPQRHIAKIERIKFSFRWTMISKIYPYFRGTMTAMIFQNMQILGLNGSTPSAKQEIGELFYISHKGKWRAKQYLWGFVAPINLPKKPNWVGQKPRRLPPWGIPAQVSKSQHALYGLLVPLPLDWAQSWNTSRKRRLWKIVEVQVREHTYTPAISVTS